jgi:hypothetical protein
MDLDMTAGPHAAGEEFEAPETIRRMLITTWALLYSMDPARGGIASSI